MRRTAVIAPVSRWLLLPLLLAALSGCATYGDWVGQMERRIAAGDTEGAMQVLERHSAEQGRDAVLYRLNRGMLERLRSEPAASVAAFEDAKARIDALLAVSVSEQAGALAVNDTGRSYVGEPYERAFLHVYAALGFLDQGDHIGARVEMLQLDVLLRGWEEDGVIVGTALPRYLSALVFEANGEWDDALIACRKAYETYRAYPKGVGPAPPRALGRDLVRLAERLGLEEEAARYRAEFGLEEDVRLPPGSASLVVLLHSGLAPVKREAGVTVPTPSARLVSVSMPYYPPPRRPRFAGARVSVERMSAGSEAAENIDAAARAALEAQRGAILARTAARAVLKHEASRQVGRENELAGLLVNIAGLVSERADTRSWTTLPHSIHLARLAVPAGRHIARIELRDAGGAVIEVVDHPIDLAPAELAVLSLHRIHPADVSPD